MEKDYEMNKVLSIVVPVYNTEKYIRRCLDSILINPVLKDIEVIVVSDGSKDSSVDIVKKEYLEKYSDTIVLIEKENGGHGSTINKGLEVATGKYFKILDSDDWLNSIDFIKFVERLKKENADLVVTNYSQQHVYNQTENIFIYKDLKDGKKYEFNKINLKILNGEYFMLATATYKLDVLKASNVHLFEKTFYVDMQYNIQAMEQVQTFTYYDLDIYRYYIGRKDQSTNVNSLVKNKLHHEKVMKYLLEYYANNKSNMTKNKEKYIEQILYYMLYTHYTIFCSYDKNYDEAYEQIKMFDEYFEKVDKPLYNRMNTMSLIRAHRKTKFKYIKTKIKIRKKFFNNFYKIIGKF